MRDLKNTDIQFLRGVGPQRARVLAQEANIHTLEDLLYFFPYKHIDRSRLYTIDELTTDMPFVQLKGYIMGFEEAGIGRKKRLTAYFTDGHGVINLVWFQGIRYISQRLRLDLEYIIFGRPSAFGGRISISHPEVEPATTLTLSTMSLQPYYSVTEKMKRAGLTSRSLEHFTNSLFSSLEEPLPETLPPSLIEKLHMMSRDVALRCAHYPHTAQELSQANMRLKFEELFFIQLSILRFSRLRRNRLAGHLLNVVGPLFRTFYAHHLPFELTEAQKRVIQEMHADMKSGRQMNRLLQGDVGSGKTLVALMVMLIALDNGCQAALMAPTEILAEQHLDSFHELLGDLDIRIELLTSNVKGKKRKHILQGLKKGDVQIIIGTHALLEGNVEFHDLGLVVIDEQHRFGVEQRARMWRKNTTPPHVLVMTATPIPRTLAMTVYGDLDVSVIDELPPGRKPVQTIHITDNRPEELLHAVQRQIEIGHQAYFVYPLVKETEKMALRNVETEYEYLRKAFPQYKVCMVHGQMKPADKDEQMRLFVSGEAQIMVATTVVEVGVNVPNASIMIIHNAERFGLSQLHQLRGRVGRGAEKSFCVLVTPPQLSAETRKRLQIMTETNDGFEIAEADLKLRGPGSMERTQQSGIPFDLKIANLARDGQLVQLARQTAQQVLDTDPEQTLPEYQVMWQRLEELKNLEHDWSQIS